MPLAAHDGAACLQSRNNGGEWILCLEWSKRQNRDVCVRPDIIERIRNSGPKLKRSSQRPTVGA